MNAPTTRLTPELESEYRKYYLTPDARQFFLGVILWTVAFVGFAYSDYLLFRPTSISWALIGIRLGYGLFSVLVAVVLRRKNLSPAALDKMALVWGIVTVVLDVGITVLRPRGDVSALINDLVGVISFYVFISGRMSVRLFPAVALTTADMLLILFYKTGIEGQVTLALAFSFTITNMVGIIFSRYFFDMRRAEFMARREEMRVRAELLRLASTDPLTGVYNRRSLLEIAGDELYRFRRYGRPFSILVMDLDGFKSVNDTYGHQQGDLVLIDFTKAIVYEKREVDSLGRMGGDEFCLVLPETSPEAAGKLANRIIQRCGGLEVVAEKGDVRVTTSIGISQALDTDTNLDALFARADAALYQAKNSGRNRYAVV